MRIGVYDATLTEGAREAGVHLPVRDRLRIALRLAEMGVAYVEGGWPGGRGADVEIFREARRLQLGGARLVACAALSRRDRAQGHRELQAALRAGAPAVRLSWPTTGSGGRGVRGAATLAEAVHAVVRAGRGAVVELTHYFEAARADAGAALAVVEAAATAGAEAVLLSDTTGGALPPEVEAATASARRAARRAAVGIWARDDAGLAVANSLAAVARGAHLVAGTVNGYGERCGGADLLAIIAGVELKMGRQALAPGQLKRLTSLAHFVAELADREVPRDQPYVGRDAFATTDGGGPAHVDPEAVGNRAGAAMADERGHPDALRVARALGLPARGEAEARRVLSRLAAWERRGFRYEGAEASFELLLDAVAGLRRPYFKVHAYRVLDLHRGREAVTEATVEVEVAGERVLSAACGVGPVHALESALRRALERQYPELADMAVAHSRSRDLAAGMGTAGPVRLVIESTDARDRWGTAGVSENFLEAACQALVDAVEYKLVKDRVEPRGRPARTRRRLPAAGA